ncbi:MAG: hypothetical protein ACK5U6_00255 [Pseudanabaena sp.]|jgi:hypothetical protein
MMAARKWTESQKERQRALIQTWQPWKLSTGAKSKEGKAKVSQNALKTGNYTAAALQADREHRRMMREYHQVFNEIIEATQEYLDLVSENEELEKSQNIF